MISLIDFKEDLIIPKEMAQELKLVFEENPRIGFRDNKLQQMSSYDHYKEDCIEKDGKYYEKQEKIDSEKTDADNSITSYYLHTKYTGDTKYVFVKQKNHLVSLLEFAPKCKYKFFVRESVIAEQLSINNLELILNRLEDKASMLDKVADKIKENTFNKKTNVHMGGGLIATYNDLLLKENICTDILQQELNNGWRIIAVCSQPDQRRPDYILGRYNPKLEVIDKPDAGR